MNATVIDELHERAASHYLQGDYASAIQSWRTILASDPTDERALEGVRLCEQFAGGDQVSVCTAGQSPFREAGSRPASAPRAEAVPESGYDPEVDDFGEGGLDDVLEQQLAIKLGLGRDDDLRAAGEPGADVFLDLSDLADVMDETPRAQPAAAGPEPAATPTAGSIAWQWNTEAVGAQSDDRSSPIEERADFELRRRVSELLAQALLAAEGERADEARRIIGRVLILDEENEAALALLRKIEAGTLAPKVGETGRAARSIPLASLQVGPFVEDPALAAPAEELVFADPEPKGDFGFEAAEDEDEASAERGPADAQSAEAPSGVSVSTGKPLTKWSALAATLALLLVGSIWGWRMFSFAADESSATPSASPEEEVEQLLAPVPTIPRRADPPRAAASAPLQPAPAPAPPLRLADLLAHAATALGSHDYEAAIVAYNKILSLDPSNAAAQAGLERAAGRYREQRELRASWDLCTASFEGGEYHEALRQFYRLDPDGRSNETITRYKVNGWLNYGLQALSAVDCVEARSRLGEAAALAPNDPEVLQALALARACPPAGDSAPGFFQRLRALEPRRIDE